jgi:signal transduction histidine kinase
MTKEPRYGSSILKGPDWLTDSDRRRIGSAFCSESACFSDLVRASGLNPATDFRFADLSSVDFKGSDLRGYDFTGANLSASRWFRAKWDESTILTDALLTDAMGRGSLEDREELLDFLQAEREHSEKLEQALHAKEDELKRIRERNEALVAADAIKIDFVQHVSYELRRPLTNIIGFTHFLDDPVTGPLTEKQREYFGYITASSNALLAIINNILDLASIGAGTMQLDLEPVDIRATMYAAAEGVNDQLVNNNIRLDIKAPADIGSFKADERRIRQVLFNLLANAVGFSPSGETVVLTALRAADAVIFAVSDHGPGISSEIKDKVFDWFESDTRGTRHRGAGLGLSIVRSFVELHGGKVRIESVPGEGTTVVCIFPQASQIDGADSEGRIAEM